MTADIDFLPVWKKGATSHERLSELSEIARKYPKRFARFVIFYEEDLENDQSITRYIGTEMSTRELLGLVEQGRMEILLRVKGMVE